MLRFLDRREVPKERPTEDDSDASVVDYSSEPEEGGWRKTELGAVLPTGVHVGWGVDGPGHNRRMRREARCGAGGAEARVHSRISFIICSVDGIGGSEAAFEFLSFNQTRI